MREAVMAVSVCLIAVGLCVADDNPGSVVVWSQPPIMVSPSAWASQQAVDVPFFAECVNDFESPHAVEITHAHWWGMYWGKKRGDARLSMQQVDWQGRPIGRALDCTGSQRVTCGADSIAGTTVGANSNVDYYGCSIWDESGPEVVFQVKIPFGGTNVMFGLEQYAVDLDLFLLTDCDENTCVAYGSVGLNYSFAEPGTYYLVVDGYEGAQGPFYISIECQDVADELMCVRFYEDVVVRDRSMPGGMLYEFWTDDFHEEYDAGSDLYSYWADLAPFPVNPGQRYWASFQFVSERFVTGQWGWAEAEPIELMSPFMDFEYLGVPRWTYFPDAPISNATKDLAFELFADPNPVESASWGTIKSLYR